MLSTPHSYFVRLRTHDDLNYYELNRPDLSPTVPRGMCDGLLLEHFPDAGEKDSIPK